VDLLLNPEVWIAFLTLLALEGVMNCGSYAVASRHGESKTVPK
jgi:hypothetical protein